MRILAALGLLAASSVLTGCGGAEFSSHSLDTATTREAQVPASQEPGSIAGIREDSPIPSNGPTAGVDSPAVTNELAQATPEESPPPSGDRPPADAEVPSKPPAGNRPPAKLAGSVERKIIYVATVQLVVKDLEETRAGIVALLARVGGYISDSEVGSRSGSMRSGRWVIRIPVTRYEETLEGLGQIGVPENIQQKAQDVTQEFMDLGARIANQRRLEERLIKLLEDRSGKLSDAIEVERELARVRTEIETAEGRLRYLQNQVSLSTITIFAREEQNYVPPQAPSFTGRVGTVWRNSLVSLQRFGENLALAIVGITPWLPLILIAIVMPIWLIRRIRKRRAKSA